MYNHGHVVLKTMRTCCMIVIYKRILINLLSWEPILSAMEVVQIEKIHHIS